MTKSQSATILDSQNGKVPKSQIDNTLSAFILFPGVPASDSLGSVGTLGLFWSF